MKLDYSWGNAGSDLLAGVTVAAISLPQAMAYALIAGLDPRFGAYSATVVTFLVAECERLLKDSWRKTGPL